MDLGRGDYWDVEENALVVGKILITEPEWYLASRTQKPT
jgi:hypothetical protein